MASELSDERIIGYDYQSTIALVGNMITVFYVLAGFAFTGIILLITGAEPITPLPQVILFILVIGTVGFVFAAWMLQIINLEISMESAKPIIPIYPTQLPIINALTTFGLFAIPVAICLTFLLRDLVILFVVSISTVVVGGIILKVFYWRPLVQKMRIKGILK